MSWSNPAAPVAPPTRMPAARAGETVQRVFDMTVPLTAANDTITTVTSVDVFRVDGQTAGANDLEIATTPDVPGPDTTGLMVEFWIESDASLLTNGTIDYRITFTVLTAAGATMVRDGYLAITAPLGPTQ